jgi:hypothetical protein
MSARPQFELLARLGFASRGLMYILIGFLALRSGRSEDGAGVLRYLSGGGERDWLLAAMALGFLGYALWRLLDAWQDGEGHGDGAKGAAARLGAAASGLAHLGFAVLAAKLALGSGGGSGDAAQDNAGKALELPGGWLLLVVLGALLAATGLYQLVKAAKGKYLETLAPGAAGQPWVQWAGRLGYAARGLVFLIVGWFFWRAGREARETAAGGIGQALDSLPPSLQTAVAAGLLIFGIFSLVEARYRRINGQVFRGPGSIA